MRPKSEANPARRRPRDRRGSVLLMVVATLALLAIIAVSYATLGRADRAASATLVRESRLDDQAAQFADYLAGVIGDNTLATYSQRTFGTGANEWVTRRAHRTYPGTDVFMVSSAASANGGAYRFDPTGSYAGPWTGNGTDPRWPGTPFLASPEPELIPDNNNLPPFSLTVLRDSRTWRHISNFAPDGRFVNLANLRRNFAAQSGVGGSAPDWRMSDRLTILNNAGNPTTAGTDPDVPADWSTNQKFAFRPAFDNLLPSDPNHVLNQWFDTDGDGFVDARWCELVDAFLDQNNPRWALPQQGRMRMFLAARCIDLSGLVNVNTASDFTLDPGTFVVNPSGAIRQFYPAGLSPSDVDLRRVLSLVDHHWLYNTGVVRGYNDLPRPAQSGLPSDYLNYNAAVSGDIGKTAYAALLHAIDSGQTLPSDARRGPPTSTPELQFPQATGSVNPNPLSPGARAARYDSFGSDPFAARLMAGTTRAARAPFGMADELELRAFHGINDSENRSRLERAVGGREFANFSPLRENRPRTLEMAGRIESSNSPTDEALLQSFLDVRRLLTTYSGARPLIDNPFAAVNPDALGTGELRFDAMEIISKLNSTVNGSSTKLTQAEVLSVFRAYAAALLPYTHRDQFPNAWDSTRGDARALSYGGSAELATRIAAHLTVNWLDAIDTERLQGANSVAYDDSVPTRVRLDVADGTLPATVPADAWETSRVLSLPTERQSQNPNSELLGPRHVNIYGVEAQPVLVEAAWYGMFTDTPRRAAVQGDDDYADNLTPGPLPGDPPLLGNITINTSLDFGNPDFLFEVVAFQLHNPFDRDLVLCNAGRVRYYVEFANRFFALGPQTAAGDGIETGTLTIPAYGTRVFYATNIRRQRDIATRINNAHTAAPPPPPPGGGPAISGSIPLDYIQQWAAQQFGNRPGMEPVRIPLVHRETMGVAPGEDLAFGSTVMQRVDLFGERTVAAGPGGAQQEPIGVAPGSTTEQRKVVYLWRVARPAASPQDFTKDILLDRMRDPDTGPGTLVTARQGGGNQNVPGTQAGNDTNNTTGDEEDNIGFSFTKWAAFRRPTDANHQRGAMPAWAMERKNDSIYTGTELRNDRDPVSPSGGVGDAADYDGSIAERRRRLLELVTDQRTSTILNLQISREAKDKTGNQVLNNASGVAMRDTAVRIHLSGNDTNPQLFSRVGDFLLPLGIGPSQNPAATGANNVQRLENQWTTLAEALALACDYYSPPTGDLFFRFGHRDNAPNPPIRPKLDRGNLALHDYVPFYDANNNGRFDLNTDEPLGPGVPLALNVLDIFETAERRDITSVNNPPTVYTWGGARKMVHGVMNLNTSPRAAMQALPMLTPSLDTDPTPLNWLLDPSAAGAGGTALFNPSSDNWDVAATLTAYRDKSIVRSRRYPFPAGGNSDVISFRDDVDGNTDENGRQVVTRIDGLRESPGFRSRGEILAARLHDSGGNLVPEHSITRLAHAAGSGAAASLRHRGLASSFIPAAGGTGFTTDEVGNDYVEQLAIANAVLNNVSVRSDVFCVWFVIHGYLPSDVENLGPNDPMIPSVARRYVMVVDRSNVVRRGEKPRIVMLQEVPLK